MNFHRIEKPFHTENIYSRVSMNLKFQIVCKNNNNFAKNVSRIPYSLQYSCEASLSREQQGPIALAIVYDSTTKCSRLLSRRKDEQKQDLTHCNGYEVLLPCVYNNYVYTSAKVTRDVRIHMYICPLWPEVKIEEKHYYYYYYTLLLLLLVYAPPSKKTCKLGEIT